MRTVTAMALGIGVGVALTLTVAAQQASFRSAADQVISITKAEWAAIMDKNAAVAVENIADDCTIWVRNFPNRLDGKELIYTMKEVEAGGVGNMVLAEMANEKVQVYGDTAVLSYNFMGMRKDAEGEVEAFRSKSTRVYVKEGGKWLLVHANFAPVEAPGS